MGPAEDIGTPIRMIGLERMADRSVVLVEAIEAFAHDHGAPPDTLEALVPSYLPAVPSTGMAAAPTYEYSTGNVPCSGENAWSIWVEPAVFETFLYCPKRDYGQPMWDRQQIGTWLLTRW
jgi:hypothetical protein